MCDLAMQSTTVNYVHLRYLASFRLSSVQVKRPAERKRLKRRGDGDAPGREKASGAKQLQEALFGTGGKQCHGASHS